MEDGQPEYSSLKKKEEEIGSGLARRSRKNALDKIQKIQDFNNSYLNQSNEEQSNTGVKKMQNLQNFNDSYMRENLEASPRTK